MNPAARLRKDSRFGGAFNLDCLAKSLQSWKGDGLAVTLHNARSLLTSVADLLGPVILKLPWTKRIVSPHTRDFKLPKFVISFPAMLSSRTVFAAKKLASI
jgi:hypothetical protein